MRFIERSADHHYTFDGVTYPGVTSILKVYDKSDALMAWASRMTAEAAVAMGESLVPLIATVGPEGAVKALTARSAWQRDEAASIGTEIHGLADLLHRGEQLPELSPVVAERVKHYAGWFAASGWKIRATEAAVVNPEVGYGGTFDLLAYDPDGRTVLADIKTGKGVYRETALQLAAYGMAKWLDMGDGTLYAMPDIARYAVLHVTASGVREIEMLVGKAERDAFRACLTLSTWREQTKGRL